jgi:hypothetical protein
MGDFTGQGQLRLEDLSRVVLKQVVDALPHLTTLDVPIWPCGDVPVIAGRLTQLHSLTLRLGPPPNVAGGQGVLLMWS